MANRTHCNSTNDINNPHTPAPTARSRHPIYHGIRCRLRLENGFLKFGFHIHPPAFGWARIPHPRWRLHWLSKDLMR
ncbi:hypothetical protein Hdeb2414_s0089g00786691 [Helianthus debilis subsp. tardiflorus]